MRTGNEPHGETTNGLGPRDSCQVVGQARVQEKENEEAMTKNESSRKRFEIWISSSPYERDVKRFPKDESKSAWPKQYYDIDVQLAWEAWCQSAHHIES